MTKEEQYLQSGAYALDALTPAEQVDFERALVDSPELATEVEELRATALLLALAATPVEPSVDLKSRLMAQIAETPQGSDTPVSPQSTVQDAPQHPLAASSVDVPVTEAAPEVVGDSVFVPRTAAEDKARSRWFSRPVGALVAAAAAVAIFVGGGAVATQFLQNNSSSSSQQASASALAEIYAASDVQTAHSAITGGGEATVLWSPSVGKSAVVAQGLPSLPAGKTYEAWYINGTSVTPAGTFTPGGDATTWHVLTGSLTTGDVVGVTIEPAGGSQTPTSTPILTVAS
ncbi:hypothetical protein B7R54_12840 [Subtercola boreus]|uniref:Regulator of SigK n=1 Tax=Subtercola boreus TaxID=120213 RepID=A0A3E0VKP4_9MICO|nr:anti-sigma factor [Subtercola boreus]RFA09990.1 hypothetical protein B7R54_12840 [Subtercola boreus]TQL52864.1 anti-sigma-K factor rskA [Subtercola boreus]